MRRWAISRKITIIIDLNNWTFTALRCCSSSTWFWNKKKSQFEFRAWTNSDKHKILFFRFYRQFFLFCFYFVLSLVSFTLRPGPIELAESTTTTSTPGIDSSTTKATTFIFNSSSISASEKSLDHVINQLASDLATNLIVLLNVTSSLSLLANLTSQITSNLTTTLRDVIINSDVDFQGLVSSGASNASEIINDVSGTSFGKNLSSSYVENKQSSVGNDDALRNLRSTVPTTLIRNSNLDDKNHDGEYEDWYDDSLILLFFLLLFIKIKVICHIFVPYWNLTLNRIEDFHWISFSVHQNEALI